MTALAGVAVVLAGCQGSHESTSTTSGHVGMPFVTFRVIMPTPHQRWKNLFAAQIRTLKRLPRPAQLLLYDASHHVVARGWLGDCPTCASAAGATLTLNVRYQVTHIQHGLAVIADPTSGYRVSVSVILTPLPAPSE